MKTIVLEDNTKLNCISRLEAQMLDIHIAGYLNDSIKIQEGDTIIDIGANIGLLGHRLSQKYENIKIIALEPIPSIYNILQENIKLSNNKKYIALPYGISDKNESMEIVYFPNSTPMSTFNPDLWNDNKQLLLAFTGTMKNAPKMWWWAKFVPSIFYPIIVHWLKKGSRNIKCKLKTLSTIIEENSLDKIDLLKIDCEGNELKVIDGIDSKHWGIIKQIVVEVHNVNNRYDYIAGILQKEGFKLTTLKEESLKETNLVNIYGSR